MGVRSEPTPAKPGWAWPKLATESRVLFLQFMALGVSLLVAPRVLPAAVDLPKRLLVEGLAIAGWVALIAERLEVGRGPFRRGGADAPLVGLAAAATVSAVLAANPGFALEHAGLAVTYVAIVWLVVSGTDRPELSRVVSALLLAGGIQGVYGILQYAGIDFLPWESSWGSRCFGSIGNPVFFAEFLAPIFVLGAALWLAERDEERKDLLALLSVVLFLALLFAQTRSAWIGAAAGVAVLVGGLWGAVAGGRDVLRRNRAWLLAFLGFVLAVGFTVSSPRVFGRHALPLRDRVADAFDFQGWSVQHRLVLWRAALLMVRDSPLLGVGPEHYRAQFPLKQATFREEHVRKHGIFAPKEQKAHNDYVQAAAEIGLGGLGMGLWFLLVLGRIGIQALKRSPDPETGAVAAGLLGGCATLVTDAFFNFPFRIIPAATVFSMMAGGLVVLARPASAGFRTFPVFPAGGGGRPVLRRAGAVAVAAAGAAWFAWLSIPQILANRALGEADRYFGSNMFEMAKEHYERSLKLRPYDPVAAYRLGLSHHRISVFDWSGRSWDLALENYRRAQSLGLNDEMLFTQMALLFEKKGKHLRSIEAARQSILIYPENPDHMANLAYWYSVREVNLDYALELAGRAIAAVPEHPLYRWMYGLVLEKHGRNGEALAALRYALPRLNLVQDGERYAPDLKGDIERMEKKSGTRPLPDRAE